MKRILVMGASGFVGKAVLKALSQHPAEIHAIYYNTPPEFSGHITWHRADILNREDIGQLMADTTPTHLLQLAWCAEHGTYWKDPANLTWLTAGIHIAQSFVKHGGQRCLFLGTSAEYDWTGNLPLNEFTSLLKPQGLYGGCKLGLYWALARYFEQEGISWVWGRLFNPFGPGEDARRLIPKTCLRLLRKEHIRFDAGLSLRDFLHVNDIGSALTSTLFSDVRGPVNIASGRAITIREVITQIALNYDSSDLVSFDASDSGNNQPDSVVADTTRLQQECGWYPEKDFSERLQETCEWWKIKQKQIKKI